MEQDTPTLGDPSHVATLDDGLNQLPQGLVLKTRDRRPYIEIYSIAGRLLLAGWVYPHADYVEPPKNGMVYAMLPDTEKPVNDCFTPGGKAVSAPGGLRQQVVSEPVDPWSE
jgi:hypothetical protein